MKASRLKTIVIVILLLVNAFLLFLLLSRRAEQTQAYERTVEQLCELFERSGVSFDRALLPENSDVYALSPERSSTRRVCRLWRMPSAFSFRWKLLTSTAA